MKILKLSLAVCLMAFLNIYCGAASKLDYSRTTYYVSSSGSASGDGSSWDDALNTESFVDVLMHMDSIHETTFYLTEGTYMLQTSDEKFGEVGVTANLGKNVTIRGGYSPTGSSDGYSPDNKTVLKVTEKPNFLLSFKIDPNAFLSIYDIYFEGKRDQTNGEAGVVSVSFYCTGEMKSEVFHVERCSFSNGCSASLFYCSGTFDQCDFDFSMGGILSVDQGGQACPLNILSCSFSGECCLYYNSDNELRVENCTFLGFDGEPVGIDSYVIHIGSPVLKTTDKDPMALFVHNTILGPVRIAGGRYRFEGNFVHGNFNVESYDYDFENPPCNLFVDKAIYWGAAYTEVYMDSSILPYLFDYEDGVYSIEKVEGQRTKYIKLKKDAYALSESECFLFRTALPISSSHKDLLGQERYVYPCYGANEYPFVVRKDYYVRRGGEGDGSSWKRAMGSSDFFNYFQIAPSSSTFHIAEGVYTPRKVLVVSNKSNPCFYTRQYVNIQGGYPSMPKEGDRPDPFVYHTIFNGALSSNEDSDDSSVPGDLYSILNYHFSEVGGTVSVSGIEFRKQYNIPQYHYTGALLVEVGSDTLKVKMDVNKCSFVDCNKGVYFSGSSLAVNECFFNRIGVTAVQSYAYDKFELGSCSFLKCGEGLAAFNSKSMSVVNSTFLSGISAFMLSLPSECSLILMNNTLLDNFNVSTSDVKSKVSIVGNILPYPVDGDAGWTKIGDWNINHNLFLYEYLSSLNPTWDLQSNKFTTFSDFYSAVANTMIEGNEVVPVLSYENTDYPPVIPLRYDMTQDSIDLRFPLENTLVSFDQWGMRRGERTCVGAYEYWGDYPAIPSAFTPYSVNGKNDIFMKGYEIYIYDRYGMLICHSKNGWDGRYQGKLVEPGVYIYVVVTRVENRKGTVEVIKSSN